LFNLISRLPVVNRQNPKSMIVLIMYSGIFVCGIVRKQYWLTIRY